MRYLQEEMSRLHLHYGLEYVEIHTRMLNLLSSDCNLNYSISFVFVTIFVSNLSNRLDFLIMSSIINEFITTGTSLHVGSVNERRV